MTKFDVAAAAFQSFELPAGELRAVASDPTFTSPHHNQRVVSVSIMKGDGRVATLSFIEAKNDYLVETFSTNMQDVATAITRLYRLSSEVDVVFSKTLKPDVERALCFIRDMNSFRDCVEHLDHFIDNVKKAPDLPHTVGGLAAVENSHCFNLHYDKSAARALRLDLRKYGVKGAVGAPLLTFLFTSDGYTPCGEVVFPMRSTDPKTLDLITKFLPDFRELVEMVNTKP